MKNDTLSNLQARRLALVAQGFGNPKREGIANWTRIDQAVRRMNLLQIDSVNVLVRSHYLPVFARAGHYSHDTLDQRTFGRRKRRFFEYWAHEASFLPLELYPLLRWKMERALDNKGEHRFLEKFGREQKAYVDEVRDFVKANGPTAVSDLPDPGGRTGNWWGWNKGKIALEYLFHTGEVTAATRRVFERLYDLPERVLPPETLNTPSVPEADAVRRLIDLSAQSLGVASEADLRDYFRLPVDAFKQALPSLVEDGTLLPVKVEGWTIKAFRHRDTGAPRKAGANTLLSPFDPLVWERSRAERLFGFRYRIEIYTPGPKRVYGYYVLPFLEGDQLTARFCLKADRQAGILRVNAAHGEDGFDAVRTAAAAAPELRRMAGWLGLADVEAAPHGSLAKALRQALKRS
ncbi:winged helix-turn-helix domain-containing protein [Nordella sp. HKS 07]|uniref:winged helix-turn-helix domain-containing protein n=1 Tax=Nordella sp. HKS 07 TaxID=2712222 RepID=UPI0013E0F199|nr:crosslink repair DNA glycosylase YcaQ family protein [Nordella sp. HKS 07]QIG51618.1 winged helix-turn-helix domain-containing protein [Nordella sp. HKS 07]